MFARTCMYISATLCIVFSILCIIFNTCGYADLAIPSMVVASGFAGAEIIFCTILSFIDKNIDDGEN